jgi:ABC-2 type transport system permease protein
VKITWRILGVAGFNFAWVKRQWMWIIQSLMFTLSIVLIAYGWGGYTIAKTVIPIFMVVSAWEFGLNIITQEVGWHRVSREWERIIASPLTLLEYFTGLVIGMLPMELASLIPLSIIAVTSGFEIQVVLFPLILTPLAMALGAFFSLSIVLRVKNPMNISAITNPLTTATVFLPPVLYSTTILPEPLRTISMGIPTVALAEIVRAIIAKTWIIPVYPIISITAWLAITTITTAKALKWGLE